MPPTDDIDGAIEKIMAPFSENDESEDASPSAQFWDWYVIGGRWGGRKLLARIGEGAIDAFRQELEDMKITVSGLRMGKPDLSPESQIPVVDALWRERFPNTTTQCPLFRHCPKSLADDVCTVADLPESLSAERVIIASAFHGEFRAAYMDQEDFWNGVNFLKSEWDGKVISAIARAAKKFEGYSPEFIEANTPRRDWIAVTVDYHS